MRQHGFSSRFAVVSSVAGLAGLVGVACSSAGGGSAAPIPPEDASREDAGPDADAPVDAGRAMDGGTVDGSLDGQRPEALPNVPNLVICQPAPEPWVHKIEQSPDTTRYQTCAAVCADWTTCVKESVARGRTQVEIHYVVDEDGKGSGFGGTLRFTKDGARDKVVLFHKGGAGVEYVDDLLPQKVEEAGATYVEPKWIEEVDTKVGWFSRPFVDSKLEKNLYGVTLRPAAVLKWVHLNLATKPFSTVGCSGGSIATYYPRHWHGVDPLLRYQLLSGGPVMSKIQAGCGALGKLKGRCTHAPDTECVVDAACGAAGGTCSPYAWRKPDLVMRAVRGTINHLHAHETSASTDCEDGTAQPAFDVSDFDSPAHTFDVANGHPIDFMMNVGSPLADDYLDVLASGAAVYAALTGPKTWTTQSTGIHCDSFKTDEAWALLKAGAGL